MCVQSRRRDRPYASLRQPDLDRLLPVADAGGAPEALPEFTDPSLLARPTCRLHVGARLLLRSSIPPQRGCDNLVGLRDRGPIAEAPRAAWLAELLTMLDLPGVRTEDAEIFLWRRTPHPDTLGPGGPEIDVGISTDNALILIEAKWLSRVGAAQGTKKDKDQIQLRGEFLKKYAPRLFPNRCQLAVVGIGLSRDVFADTKPDRILFRSTTWEAICSVATHPLAEEVRRYFGWKMEHTRMID